MSQYSVFAPQKRPPPPPPPVDWRNFLGDDRTDNRRKSINPPTTNYLHNYTFLSSSSLHDEWRVKQRLHPPQSELPKIFRPLHTTRVYYVLLVLYIGDVWRSDIGPSEPSETRSMIDMAWSDCSLQWPLYCQSVQAGPPSCRGLIRGIAGPFIAWKPPFFMA